MQEDESQSEPEQQPTSGRESDGSQPEPEQQPTSESATDQGQPRLQPRPAPPIPLPLTEEQKRRQYLWGLGWGLIPVIVFLVTFSIAAQQVGYNSLGTLIFGGLAAILLYFVELIVSLFFLANDRMRFVGYGLLTAVLASPVIAYIGCTVIPKVIHP